MAKNTSIKDALQRWEEKNGGPANEAKEVNLYFQWPPINKMDNNLAALVNCEKLSVSTNQIEKIGGIATLKNLKILSVARNSIRNFSGLEALGDSLEELWISYNLIEKLKGVNLLKKLKVLYIAHNLVKDWGELAKVNDCASLKELVVAGNPLYESMDEASFRSHAIAKLTKITKLEGDPIIREES